MMIAFLPANEFALSNAGKAVFKGLPYASKTVTAPLTLREVVAL